MEGARAIAAGGKTGFVGKEEKQGVDRPLLYAANVAADGHKPRPARCFVLVSSTWVPNTSIV